MKATDYSTAQYLGAISVALRAEDMRAVVDLLHGLAVVSPRDAQMILDALSLTDAMGGDK